MSSICPVAEFHNYYLNSSVDGYDGPDNFVVDALTDDFQIVNSVHTDNASSLSSVSLVRHSRLKGYEFSLPFSHAFDFVVPLDCTTQFADVNRATGPEAAELVSNNIFQSASYYLVSESHAIRSTRASDRVESPAETHLNRKQVVSKPKAPKRVDSGSSSGSTPIHNDSLTTREESTSLEVESVAEATAEDIQDPDPVVFIGSEDKGYDTTVHGDYCDHSGQETSELNRLEAERKLAHLLSLKFFEDTISTQERIDLLAKLCYDHDKVHQSIKVISSPETIEGPNGEFAKNTARAVSLETLQYTHNEQVLGFPEGTRPDRNDAFGNSVINDLKRKGSDLTLPPHTRSAQPFDNKTTPTRERAHSISTELSRLSLNVPVNFKFGSASVYDPPSPIESSLRRARVRCFKSGSDLIQVASSAESNQRDEKTILSFVEGDQIIGSVKSRDAHSCSNHDNLFVADDSYGGFLPSDYEELIAMTKKVETSCGLLSYNHMVSIAEKIEEDIATSRTISLSARERHSELSFPGFRGWKIGSDGTLYYDDEPIIRRLVNYTRCWWRPAAPEEIVHGALVRSFTKHEIGVALKQKGHEGHIYIYLLPGEFKTVKIGVTQRPVQTRLDEWTGQCNHKTYLAYPLPDTPELKVPHVYRVEALVHAELAANRLEELECSCGTKHGEWFGEELAHARKVVVKWSDWMRKHPYQEVQTGRWELKEEHRDDIAMLTCPSPRDVREASTSPRRPKSSPSPKAKRRSPRPDLPRPYTAPV